MKYLRLSKFLKKVFETPENTGSWFGYYNYDTLNHDQTKMLCTRTQHDAELPQKGFEVEIGYYDIPSGEWHNIGFSDSYNWPQGCMAQWLPGKGNENKIIYNTSNGVKNIAVIVDITTLEKKVIDWSIYGLTPDGKKSITLVMERSHWCRAYHYESIADDYYEGQIYKEDGIYEIDLVKNRRVKLISIQDIIHSDYESYFDSAKHWLEHIMVSPNGKRFCFLHRFKIENQNSYESRLFIADINGKNLQCIDGWKKFSWSHFAWNGDDAFTIYSYKRDLNNVIFQEHIHTNNLIKKDSIKLSLKQRTKYLLKSIIHIIPISWRKNIRLVLKKTTSYYQYYKVQQGKFKLNQNINNRMFTIDGHPSFTNDGKYMITDTYPKSDLYQDLIVYNIETKKGIVIASLFAKLHGLPGSCDLHPKLSKENKYLAVDSAYNGQHHVILFELNWDIIKTKLK